MRKSDIINLKPFISHCVLQHVKPKAEPFLKNSSVHKHELATKSQMPLLASAQWLLLIYSKGTERIWRCKSYWEKVRLISLMLILIVKTSTYLNTCHFLQSNHLDIRTHGYYINSLCLHQDNQKDLRMNNHLYHIRSLHYYL